METVIRLVNFIIDSVIIAFATIFMGSVFKMVFNILFFDNIIWIYLLSYLFYYMILEGVYGCTIGKMITKTKVIYLNKNSSRVLVVFIRTVARFIPFEPLSIIFYKDSKMWHDVISGTVVRGH